MLNTEKTGRKGKGIQWRSVSIENPLSKRIIKKQVKLERHCTRQLGPCASLSRGGPIGAARRLLISFLRLKVVFLTDKKQSSVHFVIVCIIVYLHSH